MTTLAARESSRLPFDVLPTRMEDMLSSQDSDHRLPPDDDISTDITFNVHGIPATAGSKRGFPIKRKDGSIGVAMAPDNKRSKPWMASIAYTARQHWSGELLRGAVKLTLVFRLPRPKGHFSTGRNSGHLVRESAPRHPTTKPDLTKLARAVEDALKGVLWADDSQVVEQSFRKEYAEPAGVCVRVQEVR